MFCHLYRSFQLVPSLLLHFASRHLDQMLGPPSFQVIHQDGPTTDFRGLASTLDSHPESYLNPGWQSSQSPSIQDCVFPSYVARPFGARVTPPGSVHVGFSLMDLHELHTPLTMVTTAVTAHAELAAFLCARAHEFRSGGVLVLCFLIRSVSDDQSRGGDIWRSLTHTLTTCVQRLVSCGMVKAGLAQHLLSLPIHPRTPRQTNNVLSSIQHLWTVDYSCGIGGHESSESATATGEDSCLSTTTKLNEPPLTLPHSAWEAFLAGDISRSEYAGHGLILVKALYERRKSLSCLPFPNCEPCLTDPLIRLSPNIT